MQPILVPTDFSDNATLALRYGIELSTSTKANLIVYHCTHLTGTSLPGTIEEADTQDLTVESEALSTGRLNQHVLDVYQSMGIPQIPATTSVVVEFNPLLVEAIIDFGERQQAGLIITGSHGSSGLEKFFFGSNTSSLITKSSIPILAIPATYTATSLRNICFCSDLENFEEEIQRLYPMIQELGAKLDVLYFDYGKDPGQTLVNSARSIVQGAGDGNISLQVQKAGVEISLVEHIKGYLATHSYDGMVMITHERTFWDKLFLGSKTEEMSASLKIPMLSLKKGVASPAVSY